MTNGSTMSGPGIAELDISANGDRVLIGKLVSQDASGNEYFDLYMNEGGSPNSVEVVDSPSGVIFDGMTADGSKIFFTTPDQLAGDTDSSSDLLRRRRRRDLDDHPALDRDRKHRQHRRLRTGHRLERRLRRPQLQRRRYCRRRRGGQG